MGAVRSETLNQTVPEWGATNAKRITLTGGTNVIKGLISTGILTSPGVTYTHSIYIKNNGTTNIIVGNNLDETLIIYPNESKLLIFKPVSRVSGLANGSLQFTVSAPAVADNIDMTVWRAKIEAGNYTPWSDGNTATVDNTTPKYVGYSLSDDITRPSNLLLNGSLQLSTNRWYANGTGTTFTRNSLGFSTIDKTQATTGRGGVLTGTDYTLYGSVEQGKTYTLSLDVFVASLTSGSLASSSAYMRIAYADSSVVDLNLDIAQTIGSWQRLAGTITLVNKPIRTVTVAVQLAANFVGKVHVKNVKLEGGSTATPYANHITERGASYSWSYYGIGLSLATIPLTRFIQSFNITNKETKFLRLSMNVIGNSHVIINRPLLKKSGAGSHVQSQKEFLQALPVKNNGTWKAYPIFEIENKADNGLIGIVNNTGGALQFGNIANVDSAIAKSDVVAVHEKYTSNKQPSGFALNAGHVSNYPNAEFDPERPNKVGGNFEWTGTGIARPKYPTNNPSNAWGGPTLTNPIPTPAGGNKNGGFECVEYLTFKTDAEKRGRVEVVVASEPNDIIMGTTIHDSSAIANEIYVEYRYGTTQIFVAKLDLTKFKTAEFKITMRRDSSGKLFTWNFENVRVQSDGSYKSLTSQFITYNSATVNNASVGKVSRWFMAYADGTTTRTTVRGIHWSHKVKVDGLAIRKSPNTNSTVFGKLPKGVVFSTTAERSAQKVVNNNLWYCVIKDPSNRIPASGWVSAYYLEQLSRREDKVTETVNGAVDIRLRESKFTWLASDKPVESKDPFKAGDKVVVNTYDKTLFVNGVEREDLSNIGSQWDSFALESGEHVLKFINSEWASNTMEVTTKIYKTYL